MGLSPGQHTVLADAEVVGGYRVRMIIGAPYDKKIEFRTVREREPA